MEGRVRTVPVVAVEPGLEVCGAVSRVRVEGGVGPFAE